MPFLWSFPPTLIDCWALSPQPWLSLSLKTGAVILEFSHQIGFPSHSSFLDLTSRIFPKRSIPFRLSATDTSCPNFCLFPPWSTPLFSDLPSQSPSSRWCPVAAMYCGYLSALRDTERTSQSRWAVNSNSGLRHHDCFSAVIVGSLFRNPKKALMFSWRLHFVFLKLDTHNISYYTFAQSYGRGN